MPTKTYSLKTHGRGYTLSANFILGEFASGCGSDTVLVDDALVDFLQKIRNHFGTAVTINSAYRTEAHNRKVGGAANSQHCKGTAADIVVKGVTPLAVAQYAEALGMGGIGHYPAGQGSFTHIDTRAGKYRWEQRGGKEVAVSGFGGKTFAQQVQAATGFEASTMTYLEGHAYATALMYKLAEAIYKKAAKGIGGDYSNQVQQAAGLDYNTMAYLRLYKYGDVLLEKLTKAMK